MRISRQTQPIAPLPAVQQQQFATKKLILISGLAFATIGIVAAIYSTQKDCDVTSDFPLIGNDHNQAISQEIPSCPDQHTFSKIHQTSLDTIEQFVNKNNMFGNRTFIDKLQQDCKIVQALGSTHNEFADHLATLIESATNKMHLSDPFKITYDPSKLSNSTIGKCSKSQRFQMQWMPLTEGIPQTIAIDIFNRTINQPSIFLKNPKNNVTFLIDASRFINDIRKYGYYDGMNPLELAAFFTGRDIQSIKNAIKLELPENETNTPLSSYPHATRDFKMI